VDRTERLLDIVALFLDANEPISLDELRDAFPDEYGGARENSQRKWERDKQELLDLGVPLTFVQQKDEQPAGYVMDKEAYYLPELGLSVDELAVLYAAGSAVLASGAFPGRQDLAHALRKVGFFSDGPLPAPAVRLDLGDTSQFAGRLDVLWDAIGARKTVELDYFSPHRGQATTRKVNPYGLALRRGVWNLVGWCHLRQSVRTFHVHRIQRLAPNTKSPRVPDFEVPADFRVDAWVATWPWQHHFHAPIEVEISLRGDLAPLASKLFGTAATQNADDARVFVSASDLDGLVNYVLSLGAQARIIAPIKAVERARELAQLVLSAHEVKS